MNRLRIIGLVLLAALLVWLAVSHLVPEPPEPTPVPVPIREAFHPTKPLRIEVVSPASAQSEDITAIWLTRELHHLLARGKMKLASPTGSPSDSESTGKPFTLRVELKDNGHADISLVAPDGIVDKRETFELSGESQLATMHTYAQRLPAFLNAPSGTSDWTASLGTSEASAYEAFLNSGNEIYGRNASGFTSPPHLGTEAASQVERLEKLSRRHRDFARARALLALGYLSVGGEDQASLTKLAETAAERALTSDAEIADARAALGIVRLRRMEWTAAQEHFEAALAIDPNSLPALEGLSCLLMDVGQARAALPIAVHVTRLQPGNRGGRQCATYASLASGSPVGGDSNLPVDVARIYAAISLLAGDRPNAEALLRANDGTSEELTRSIVDASATKEGIPEALQVVTRSADEEAINAEAEILFGAALRRPDFVFNRMLRLAKQNEAVPLRVLWLPQTDFLRKHRRFKEVVSAATLTTYWQDHGLPDICASEPKVHGCALRAPARD